MRTSRWRKPATIYFLHIPKTAGSSVARWLSEQIGDKKTCMAKIWDQLILIRPTDLGKYKLFCGHFGVDLEFYLQRKLISFTVLRDPLLRTISHYNHVHRDTNHPMHYRVSRESFDEFVRNRHNWSMIENLQARYLVSTPILFGQYADHCDQSEEKASMLSVAAETTRFLLDPVYVRDKSFENLERVVRVAGTTDRMRDFLRRVAQELQFSLDGERDLPFENVSPVAAQSADLLPGTLEIVRGLTRIDQELYDYVKRRNEVSAPP